MTPRHHKLRLADVLLWTFCQGSWPYAEAVVDAGAVRFRPMALTAAAVIVGSASSSSIRSSMALTIFLIAGEVASLMLSRVTVPVLYFISHQKRQSAASPLVPSPAERCHESPAKISRVLVGVDFDDASALALKMAGVLASVWDAEVTVFHSAPQEVPAYFTAAQLDALEAEREQSRVRTADQTRAIIGQHVARTARVVVQEILPADGMLRMADSFDLVVVGTHRRHGRGRDRPSLPTSGVRRPGRCHRSPRHVTPRDSCRRRRTP